MNQSSPTMNPLPFGRSLRTFWTRWNRSVEFQLVDMQPDKIFVAKPIEWIEIAEGQEPEAASFSLSLDAAQRLMDWLCWLGIRPAEHIQIADNKPVIDAQKEHIADLRDLTKRLSDKFLK